MAESWEHMTCKTHACEVLSGALECPLPLGYRSDFCGTMGGLAIYAETDCKRVRGEMLCWISVYALEDDALIFTWPCPLTPWATEFPRELVIGNRECLSCNKVPVRNRALKRIQSS